MDLKLTGFLKDSLYERPLVKPASPSPIRNFAVLGLKTKPVILAWCQW